MVMVYVFRLGPSHQAFCSSSPLRSADRAKAPKGQSSGVKPYNWVHLLNKRSVLVAGGVKVTRLGGESLDAVSGWLKPERPARKSGAFALPLTRSVYFSSLVLESAEMAPYAVTKNDCFSVTKQIPGFPSHHFSKSSCMFRKVGSYVGPLFSFAFPHRGLHGRSRFKLCFNSMHTVRDYFL